MPFEGVVATDLLPETVEDPGKAVGAHLFHSGAFSSCVSFPQPGLLHSAYLAMSQARIMMRLMSVMGRARAMAKTAGAAYIKRTLRRRRL